MNHFKIQFKAPSIWYIDLHLVDCTNYLITNKIEALFEVMSYLTKNIIVKGNLQSKQAGIKASHKQMTYCFSLA